MVIRFVNRKGGAGKTTTASNTDVLIDAPPAIGEIAETSLRDFPTSALRAAHRLSVDPEPGLPRFFFFQFDQVGAVPGQLAECTSQMAEVEPLQGGFQHFDFDFQVFFPCLVSKRSSHQSAVPPANGGFDTVSAQVEPDANRFHDRSRCSGIVGSAFGLSSRCGRGGLKRRNDDAAA